MHPADYAGAASYLVAFCDQATPRPASTPFTIRSLDELDRAEVAAAQRRRWVRVVVGALAEWEAAGKPDRFVSLTLPDAHAEPIAALLCACGYKVRLGGHVTVTGGRAFTAWKRGNAPSPREALAALAAAGDFAFGD